MKWVNRGHEFDATYENIRGLRGVYLFGAGHDGALVWHVLTKRYTRLEVLGFIDNNAHKIGTEKCGLRIYSLDEIEHDEGVGIIVSFASEYTLSIDRQLMDNGWTASISFWHYEEFLSVYAAYEYGELFFPTIGIIPSNVCNLHCRDCLNFTNHIEKFASSSLDSMREEMDLYFRCIDYTGFMQISGGEPFLYPHLSELLEYIYDNYSDKLYELGTVTNGTIAPTEKILDTIAQRNIGLVVDDYRKALPDRAKQISENIAVFMENIPEKQLELRRYDEWISLYPHDIPSLSEEELIAKYNSCHCPWCEYKAGKIWSCNYASFADTAGICKADSETESYALRKFTSARQKELMEFRLGYTQRGYVDFCRKCAGYKEENPYRVSAAEQA